MSSQSKKGFKTVNKISTLEEMVYEYFVKLKQDTIFKKCKMFRKIGLVLFYHNTGILCFQAGVRNELIPVPE